MNLKPVKPQRDPEALAERLRRQPSHHIANNAFFTSEPRLKLRGDLKEELRQVFLKDRGPDGFQTQEEMLMMFISMGLRQWRALG